MGPPLTTVLALAVVMATPLAGEENEAGLDYAHWNYREGADRVNVGALKSLTRILDKWGNNIFSEIKNILHNQPNSVLPDYSRVRPLAETLGDLFKEVGSLQRRIGELNERLGGLDRHCKKYGYGEVKGGAQVTQALRGSKVMTYVRRRRPAPPLSRRKILIRRRKKPNPHQN
ncbi:uncharacterized protein si:ch211-243a20.3 [Polyodon spathula]|uniref:uncharacterized protein si:ch211-243a20.3 n=1 Tax=Polyodon spathula TaxID=7913 RepID=UPI001B7E400E|nr:uncharacterized protein si:ch211-243a20.3 [Polyodon spathula]